MAITDKEKGVWGLDQVYNKINQGSIWEYDVPDGDPTALFAWGGNTMGGSAQNNLIQYSSPIQITGTNWIIPESYAGVAVAMTKFDGTLWSWGYNYRGSLGQNSTVQYSSPVQIPGTTWDKSYPGHGYMAATKTDGTLWAWGGNDQGQLGQNSHQSPGNHGLSSPVQIPGTWSDFDTSQSTSFGIKTDGTLWVWGYNSNGVLGQGSWDSAFSSPTQIPGTTWKYVRQSFYTVTAIKTDGTLWGWGNNSQGQLGLNTALTSNLSPLQIPGTTWEIGKRKFSAGDFVTYAIKTDGTLWAMGRNTYGGLGQNNRTSYSSPTQIPGTTWETTSASYEYGAYFVKTDGTAWGIGQNSYWSGGFPLNAPSIQYSSPVQIPGTTWKYLQGSRRNGFGVKEV